MTQGFLDTLMERTVIPSFSSIGFGVRKRLFDWRPLKDYDLSDQIVVITGATSGIGEAAAERYARMGATVVIVARNPEKTETLVNELRERSGNENIDSVIADLGELDAVCDACMQLQARYERIDTLAHNAGALFNERRRASSGTDLSVELMVAAPFLMTGLCLPLLSAGDTPGRVLTMSSGGMYTEALTVDKLQMSDEHYQGAQQYARAKRAQVTLNRVWAERIHQSQCVYHALHPGWVDTPGIQEALPGFSKVLGPLGLLRSADVGADTLVWLSADDQALKSSGAFWHDRAVRSEFMSERTREADTEERRERLWNWCESHTGFTFETQTAAQTAP